MMQILTKHTGYTDEELTCFKEESDKFMQIWMELCGYDGCTNDMRIVNWGHVLFYMRKYKCLYR
jgi:hypothetical protein